MIENIKIELLYPNPMNPRKSLGDLTELTESIKQSGVMQNLTVVPGHQMTDAEYFAACDEYNKAPTEEKRQLLNNRRLPDGYTVIIGHRRLAASKAAGLTELPCAVTEMDEKQCLATMLLENMNRQDLTVIEQADGIQLMFDMGDSVTEISDKTGFSETTIRRRMKLCELDRKSLTDAEARGASLADYSELEKVESLEEKNSLLEKAGTASFHFALNEALARQDRKKILDHIIRQYQSHGATEVKEDYASSKLRFLRFIQIETDGETEIEINEDEKPLYYSVPSYYGIYLYTDRVVVENVGKGDDDIDDNGTGADIVRLKELAATAYRTRTEFFDRCSPTKNDIPAILRTFMYLTLSGNAHYGTGTDTLIERWGLDADIDYDICDNRDKIKELSEKSPGKVLLDLLRRYTGDSERNNWLCPYREVFEENETLDRYYELLKQLGYEMSEDEIMLQDGTHEAYGEFEPDGDDYEPNDNYDYDE